MFADAIVDALVVSAEDDEILLQAHLVGDVLVEAFAIGRDVDHVIVVALGLQGRDAAVDGLALHHHTGKAAIGIVVHASPFVACIVAQVVQMNLCQSLLLCPRQNRLVDKPFEHLGQYSDNIYSHHIAKLLIFEDILSLFRA